MRPFSYLRPHSIAEAASMAASAQAPLHYLAGGTSLIDLMKQGVEIPATVIDLNFASDLKIISVGDTGSLRVGAGVTLAQAARDRRVQTGWPLLHETILDGLTPQLRNAATFGGNISQRPRCYYFRESGFKCNKKHRGSGCAAREGVHYAHAIFGAGEGSACIAVHPSDLAVALTAFDAKVHLLMPDGAQRDIPIGAFLLDAGPDATQETAAQSGEMIIALEIPPQANCSGDYMKVPREGFAMASAATLVAVESGTIAQASLAMGGVAHRPWRSTKMEAFLIGKPPTVENFAQAAEIACREATTDEQTAFRVPLLREILIESLTRAANLGERA